MKRRQLDERYSTSRRNYVSSMDDIGALLRKRRKELGYTQEEVAAHLGRSPRLIGEIERGRGSVGLSKVLEYAHGLGIDFILEVRGK